MRREPVDAIRPPGAGLPAGAFGRLKVYAAPRGATVCRGWCAADREQNRGAVTDGPRRDVPGRGLPHRDRDQGTAALGERAVTGGWFGVWCDYGV